MTGKLACLAAGVVALLTTVSSNVAAQEASAKEATSIQEVVVTGSRIKRVSGFEYPVPISVIGGNDMRDSGYTMLADALTNLPQALNSTGIQNTAGTLFNAGESRVDLRGLGSQRTLVLVDGRRHLTGDFRNSSVDLNVIPSTMIERVEVISGGASAVYGSEAISGVVNIILRKELKGLDVDAEWGDTEHNDGQEYKTAVGYGMNFADGRGHFLIGGEFGRIEPIYQKDRDWAYPGIRRDTSVPAGSYQTIVPQSRSPTMPTATFELIPGNPPNPASAVSISLDRGSIVQDSYFCSTLTVSPFCQDPQLFYSQIYNVLQVQQKRGTARAYTSFDLSDNAKWYADLSYAHVEGFAIFQPSFSTTSGSGLMPVFLYGDNAYLNGTSPLAAQLRTFWTQARLSLTQASKAAVGKFWQEFGDRNSLVSRDSYRAVSGVEGKFDLFGRKVDYDIYGQYSELDGYTLAYNVPYIKRVQQATDAVLVNGQIVCRSAAAQAAGCVPWDLLNGPSPAAVAWANANARADGVANQSIAAVNFSTSVVELPAGSLGLALGGEYRKEESDQIQDPIAASGQLFYNALGRTKGKYDIKEGYLEVAVPLLKGLPLVDSLSIEGAARIGDYSTVGGTHQWRFAGEWAPIRDFRFRGSVSTAVRAPNITELYAPRGQNFTTAANDPCDRAQVGGLSNNPTLQATVIANCASVIPGYNPATFTSNIGVGRPSLALLQGGNPNLSAETARTYTAGFAVKPRVLPDIEFTADYWRIQIDNAVSTIPINTLFGALCYDATVPVSSNYYCGLIHRDSAGNVTLVEITNQNVQGITTRGVDVGFTAAHDFGPIGGLRFSLAGTRIIQWDLQGAPGQPITHFAGVITGPNTATPHTKIAASLQWRWNALDIGWDTHWISSTRVSETQTPLLSPFYTGYYAEHDLHFSYKVNDALAVRLGVINVTDEHPPLLPEVFTATGNSALYDNRGRWFFAGAHYTY
jgi:outer membrane receptor protein involved in Fe transport